ncbi:MAG: DUF2220 family protein [Spirochaetaceae bacterium]|jgi:hypothetical protein|nr:DUF2220 family protein [Spirochaetaceae bacterium]
MTFFEKHIIDIFFDYFVNTHTVPGKSVSFPAGRIYPEFENAPPNKKASFLEAAEALEKRGLIKLAWYKYRNRQAIKRIECVNRELLFSMAERPFPKKVTSKIKETARIVCALNEIPRYNELLKFIAENVTITDIEHGMDDTVFEDFIKLVKTLYNAEFSSGGPLAADALYDLIEGITPRALSVRLYNDPKRIAVVRKLLSRLLNRAQREGFDIPDFSFLSRAFPETFIAGKIKFHFNDSRVPMVNATGSIIGLPLATIKKIKSISVIKRKDKETAPSVLTVENKETFYALANSKKYSCLLYTGGYPSRAVNSMVRVLSKAGFDFFHAGDVDPDGILILQDLHKNAKKPVTPVCMDPATFHKYRKHGRKLEISMLNNIRLINETIRSVNGIEDLLSLIESTGLGIEQELIDYGCT